jgi:MFS transporter, ACS family, glucarate transporter
MIKKRHQMLGVLGIFSVITYLDRTAISLTSSSMCKDLALSDEQFGMLASAFALAYGAFEIPTGLMGDRMGPRKVLIRVVIWWSIFTILTGFSYTFTALMVVRFLFGAGEAGAYPNATVAISKWFPKSERGGAQSIVWMASRCGGALAPLLVLPIMTAYGWRSVFFIFGTLGILWVVFWAFWFKDEPRDMPGISSEEVAVIEAGRDVKKASHGAISWNTLFSNKNLWALMGMYHFLLYGAYFYLTWMPKYLEKGRHIPKEKLIFMASLPFIMGAVGCLIGGFASDYLSKRMGLKLGRRIVGMTGLIVAGICMIIATLIKENNVSIIFLSLGLAFKDFTLPVSWAVATDIGGENAGAVSGAMSMSGQLGSTIMATAFGFIVAKTGSYELPVQIIGCLVIIGGFLWMGIDASKKLVVN